MVTVSQFTSSTSEFPHRCFRMFTQHMLALEHKPSHNIQEMEVQRGVHYTPVGTTHGICSVKMVQQGGEVTFREPRFDCDMNW